MTVRVIYIVRDLNVPKFSHLQLWIEWNSLATVDVGPRWLTAGKSVYLKIYLSRPCDRSLNSPKPNKNMVTWRAPFFVFLTLGLENVARPWHNKITVKSNTEIFNSCSHWLQCHNANPFFSEALTCSTVKSPRLSKLWPAVEFELTFEGQDDSTRWQSLLVCHYGSSALGVIWAVRICKLQYPSSLSCQ